jgi:hypothetical protein
MLFTADFGDSFQRMCSPVATSSDRSLFATISLQSEDSCLKSLHASLLQAYNFSIKIDPVD